MKTPYEVLKAKYEQPPVPTQQFEDLKVGECFVWAKPRSEEEGSVVCLKLAQDRNVVSQSKEMKLYGKEVKAAWTPLEGPRTGLLFTSVTIDPNDGLVRRA